MVVIMRKLLYRKAWKHVRNMQQLAVRSMLQQDCTPHVKELECFPDVRPMYWTLIDTKGLMEQEEGHRSLPNLVKPDLLGSG